MEKFRLLVADPSTAFGMSLTMLMGDFEVMICRDGIQAMEQLMVFRPDAVVADLALTGVDGLTLLRTAAALAHRPALLAVTRICTEYVQAQVEQIGVDYLVPKPCKLSCLAERVRDLCCQNGGKPVLHPAQSGSAELLMELGLTPGRSGFHHLEDLIRLYERNRDSSFTKELYPAVGRERGLNGQAVERAVRSLITDAWLKRDDRVWGRYFSPLPGGSVRRPTNREFIATLAAAMCYRQRNGA